SRQHARTRDRLLSHRQRREADSRASDRHHGADPEALRPIRPRDRQKGLIMATTMTTEARAVEGVVAGTRKPVPVWIWLGVVVAALLPLIGGQTGLISNFTFLQLS